MAGTKKAQSITDYMARESTDSAQSGVNPYEVTAEYESNPVVQDGQVLDPGSVGGRPSATLRIRGGNGA